MKSSRRKLVYVTLSILIVIMMVPSFVLSLRPINKNEKIVAKVEQVKQLSGFCKVTVSMTELGNQEYNNAKKFQVYDNIKGNAISAVTELDKPSVVFPAKKTGDTVTVKLYDSNSEETAKVNVKLSK